MYKRYIDLMSIDTGTKRPDGVGINPERIEISDEEIIESVTNDMKDTLCSDYDIPNSAIEIPVSKKMLFQFNKPVRLEFNA